MKKPVKEDRENAAVTGSTRPRSICIVSPRIAGPWAPDEISIEIDDLAEQLATAGHKVDVLVPRAPTGPIPFTHWANVFQKRGVGLHCLFEPAYMEHQHSYLLFAWLNARYFDAIIFCDQGGLGYWSILAKHQGVAFLHTALIINLLAPTDWAYEASATFWEGPQVLQRQFMERRALKHADAVLARGDDLIAWMEAKGMGVPEHRCSLANLVSLTRLRNPLPLDDIGAAAPTQHRLSEVVFCGPLGTAQGLDLFCDALDVLAKEVDGPAPGGKLPPWKKRKTPVEKAGAFGIERVTFLGSPASLCSPENPLLEIIARSKNWPFPARLESSLSIEQQIDYLARPGLLVVFAGRTPLTNYLMSVCRLNGVPFIVGDTPNVATQFNTVPTDFVFQRRRKALAALLKEAVRRPASDWQALWLDQSVAAKDHKTLLAFLENQISRPPAPALEFVSGPDAPRVSVCISYFNRPDLLEQALESLRRQDYPNVEVVVVDDASPSPESKAYTAGLADEFASRGWKLLRNETEQWQSVSRNRAAQASTGDYILIMDDDNVARPNEVSLMVAVARRTGAKAISCLQNLFEGNAYPDQSGRSDWLSFFPVGNCAALGPVWNVFGDVNVMYSRQAFLDELGGFSPRIGVGCEDYEIGAEGALRGIESMPIPFPLYDYRFSTVNMAVGMSNQRLYYSHQRVLTPFVTRLPAPLRNAVIGLHNSYYSIWQREGHAYWRRETPDRSSFEAKVEIERPTHAEFIYQLAGVCLEKGATEAADRMARAVLFGHPNDWRLYRLAARTAVAAGSDRSEAELLELADRHLVGEQRAELRMLLAFGQLRERRIAKAAYYVDEAAVHSNVGDERMDALKRLLTEQGAA